MSSIYQATRRAQALLRATFLLKKPAPRGSATKIGNDPARVCAALKLIRYDSQGDRSLSWLAGRDGKSSADGLGQASSNAHCPCWRVQCLINLSVASCNVSTGQNMYPNVLDVCAQRRVTGGSNIQWAHFPRSSLLATEQAGIYNVCAV